MPESKLYPFRAVIYKTGINFCVDVPAGITSQLIAVKGYIRIKGTVNNIPFTKSLVPVKGASYRLFINTITIKNIRQMVGQVADLVIEQDTTNPEQEHPMSPQLRQKLEQKNLLHDFDALPASRRKEVLRYLNNLKTPQILEKQVNRLIGQLEAKAGKALRIP
ncbi:DUF1905 domain-containing protein [Mucilaginibacter sp. AW1-3]